MHSHTASEPCRVDGKEQQHPKPWGGFLYWETGNMEMAKSQNETVFFCDKKDQIRGWTEEAARMSAVDHGT